MLNENKIILPEEYRTSVALEFSHKLAECTLPIFKSSSNIHRPYTLQGSGVLFEFEESHFLITAGHVLPQSKLNDLYIFSQNYNFSLLRSYKNFVCYDNGEVDLAIIQLKSDFVKKLKNDAWKKGERSNRDLKYRFVNLNETKINHSINDATSSNIDHILSGFPYGQNKQEYKVLRKYNIKLFYFLTKSHKCKDCSDSDIHKLHFVTVRFKKSRQLETNKFAHLPDPRGMSGGGLWYIPEMHLREQPKLVGINVEYQRNHFYSIKIDVAIELIREAFQLKRLPKTFVNIRINNL